LRKRPLAGIYRKIKFVEWKIHSTVLVRTKLHKYYVPPPGKATLP